VRAVGWTACYDFEKHSVQQVDCLKGCPVFVCFMCGNCPDRHNHTYSLITIFHK